MKRTNTKVLNVNNADRRLMLKSQIKFFLVVILIAQTINSCSWEIEAKIDTAAYSYPTLKEKSTFQYPEFSQYDLMFIEKLTYTVRTNCSNIQIKPTIYLISPSGEKQYFGGLETIEGKNGTHEFLGVKGNRYRTDKDVISYGIPLQITGE